MKITTKNFNQSWEETKKKLSTTILANRYIPNSHKKLLTNQAMFLTYDSEELLYGGMAGGGKSDALLMAGLQYVSEPDYHALLLRRTYKDLALPNAIMNRCSHWLSRFVASKEVKFNSNTKTYTFPSGATLTFGYLAHDNDLDQYQGSELQFVGFDELTQFTERQYTYLHSRLRKLENSDVPIRMRAGTNPGGRGHDWVKNRFIREESEIPFIPSSYLDNIYLDRENYGLQLEKLDELTKRQLKYGDWDAELSEGLLINRDQLKSAVIEPKHLEEWKPVLNVIGIDKASTGTDEFALASLTAFNNGKVVVTNLDGTTSSYPEELTRNFIKKEFDKYKTYIVNFEKEPGSDFHYAGQYWDNVLKEFLNQGVLIKQTPDSNSKFNRARPHARAIQDGKLFFSAGLDLHSVFNQYIYAHPDKEVMKEYPSPDRLDAISFAWMEIVKLINI